MDPDRAEWNSRHKLLRRALDQEDGVTAVAFFLQQHAMVHDAGMSRAGLRSFADELWEAAGEETVRCLPAGCEHSIAWLVWHIARIEDVTMNALVAGQPQVFTQGAWQSRLNVAECHTGNVVMDRKDVAALSRAIDVAALRAYRQAVGRATRQIFTALGPEEFKQKVDPGRLQALVLGGYVPPEASGLIAYWGRLSVAGLLIMPPTRHALVHLHEALKVKAHCR